MQRAPDTKAQGEVNGCAEQDKAEVEFSTAFEVSIEEEETNIGLQKAPDTSAQAKVQGGQEQNKGEGECSPKGKETYVRLQKALDTKAQTEVNVRQKHDHADTDATSSQTTPRGKVSEVAHSNISALLKTHRKHGRPPESLYDICIE